MKKTIFLDYIDFERVNTLLEGFNQSTGFVTAIIDLDGNILSKSGWRQICTEFHRKNPETASNCIISDTELANRMKEGEKYHFYKCINGLVDVAVPIVIKGEHIANLFSGQFFFEEPDISFFKKQAKIYGFDENSYLKVLGKVPIVSREKVEVTMNFLLSITQMITELTFEKFEQLELNEAREKSEAALQESEAFTRVIMDNLPIGLAVNSVDPEVDFTYLNDNFPKFYHTIRESLVDRDAFWEVVYEDPQFRAELKKRVLDDCASGDPEKMLWENVPITCDGQVVAYISARNTPVPDKDLMISTVWDVTDRIKAEEDLRESEEKYRFLAENSLDVIWTADFEGNLTYISPAIEKLFGFTPEEIMGMPMPDYIVREDYDALLARLAEELAKPPAERARSVIMEARYITKDNCLIYVELNASWIKDGQGNFIGVQGSTRDITERKQLKEQIIENKQMYRSVVDTQQEMICRYLPDTTLTFVNDALCRYFGKPRRELLGQKYLMFIPPEHHEELLAVLKRLHPVQLSDTREFEETLPDGSTRWQEWTDIALFNESGELKEIQGVGRDITKRKLAEENMLQAYDATIEGWAHALDLKDEETEEHSRRVTELTLRIAGMMGIKEEELVHVRRGALLHDIGKMGIPDNILLKPGKLTDEEWEIMRKHPVYAYDMLSKIHYLRQALEIPYCHHEKWDGGGYPRGLKEEQIPLTARIFAVVDVYDALTSDRPYCKAWPRERTLEHIRELSGTHFDPQVVDVFMKEIVNLD